MPRDRAGPRRLHHLVVVQMRDELLHGPPFALATEYSIFAQSLSDRPSATIGFLLGSCCVAVVYNVVLFQSVRTLSSVGTAILG